MTDIQRHDCKKCLHNRTCLYLHHVHADGRTDADIMFPTKCLFYMPTEEEPPQKVTVGFTASEVDELLNSIICVCSFINKFFEGGADVSNNDDN